MWDTCILGNCKQYITTHGIITSFPQFNNGCFYKFKIKYQYGETYTALNVSKFDSSNPHILSSLSVTLFIKCRPTDTDTSQFPDFNYHESPSMKF